MKLKYFRVCSKCDDILEVKTEVEALVDVCDKCIRTKECNFCKKVYAAPHRHGPSKYCSQICKSRANMQRNGKAAKPFKCHHCGELFKRRSAKNTLCLVCRDKFKLGDKMSKAHAEYPKLDRISEVAMIDDWLNKNEVKKVN